MKKFLDEIMRESDKGYINDLEYIEVLAKKIISLTYEELSAAKGYNTAALITELVRANHYPECDVDTISFGDMLTLAAFNDYCEYDRFYDELANLLLLISPVNTDVRLFTSVSVKALMELVDKKTGTDKGSGMYEKIEKDMEKYFCLIIGEDTTVKQLADTLISKMTYRPLSVYMEEFNDIVDVSLEILETLIVKALRAVFSEELDYKLLQERICGDTDMFDDDFAEGLPGFKEFYGEEEKEYYIMPAEDTEKTKDGNAAESSPVLLPWDDIVQRIKNAAAIRKKAEENR